ncbi:hypothetical protein J2Y55_004760 [Bosea sp. BE125]|uniref:hypothetical protein n=1 Tax=Bosea sp. BE125 TaxID=2817909 RepID=UPI0028616D6E|nr:hypothetical protein [Bosea sp. BE125]MDR6873731.1 hypothetical protein [Bosea sp. BE125]
MTRLPRVQTMMVVFLCCAPDAMAQPDFDGPAVVASDASRCTPDRTAQAPLSEPETGACRRLWQDAVAISRQRALLAQMRAQRERAEMLEAARLLATRGAVAKRPPATIETFLGDGQLAYGDVVVIEGGPRVFVGRPGESPDIRDFVSLASPRSPHRARAAQYEGALPERRSLQSGEALRKPPSRQERQP